MKYITVSSECERGAVWLYLHSLWYPCSLAYLITY